MRGWKLSCICAAVLLTATMSTSVLAQQPPPGGGGGGGFGGGRGFGGQRGGFGGRGFGAPTLANLPVTYLTAALSLTDDQKTKIQAVQDKVRTDMRAAFQPDASGQRPDPATMQATMKQINDQAKADIEAVLTDGQKKKEDSVVKEAGTYQGAGLPLEVVADLKLTADQKTKIAAIAEASSKEMQASMKEANDARQAGDDQKAQEIRQSMQAARQATQEKVQAVLTDAQKATLDQYVKDHPRGNRRGGPGAPGGNGNA